MINKFTYIITLTYLFILSAYADNKKNTDMEGEINLDKWKCVVKGYGHDYTKTFLKLEDGKYLIEKIDVGDDNSPSSKVEIPFYDKNGLTLFMSFSNWEGWWIIIEGFNRNSPTIELNQNKDIVDNQNLIFDDLIEKEIILNNLKESGTYTRKSIVFSSWKRIASYSDEDIELISKEKNSFTSAVYGSGFEDYQPVRGICSEQELESS